MLLPARIVTNGYKVIFRIHANTSLADLRSVEHSDPILLDRYHTAAVLAGRLVLASPPGAW